jgi:acyl-coenzyme A thioesterase PaaI-like protein
MITAEEFVTLLNTEWSRGTMIATNPSAELDPERFPLTLQLSVNLIGNTDRGSLTAEAEIVHRGRITLVIEARVDRQRLIAKLVATQLAPLMTGAAARPGR